MNTDTLELALHAHMAPQVLHTLFTLQCVSRTLTHSLTFAFTHSHWTLKTSLYSRLADLRMRDVSSKSGGVTAKSPPRGEMRSRTSSIAD